MKQEPGNPDLNIEKRGELKWLIAILFWAFVARVAVAWYLHKGGEFYWSDEWFYDSIARNLLLGNGYVSNNPANPLRAEPTVMWPPGQPLFLAFVYFFTGSSIFAARLAGTLVAVIGLLAVWLIGKELNLDRRVRLTSVFLLSFYPYYIFVPATLYPQIGTSTLLALSVWLLLFAYNRFGTARSYLAASGAGLAAGLCSLFTPYTIAGVPLGALWLWKINKQKPMFKQAVLFTLLSAVIFIGWPIRNYLEYGRPLVSVQLGFNLWTANNEQATTREGNWIVPPPDMQARLDQADELGQYDIYVSDAKQFIRENPGKYLKLVAMRTVNFFSPYPLMPVTANEFQSPKTRFIGGASYFLLLTFALVGLVVFIRKGGNIRLASVILTHYLPVLLVTALIVYRDRYRLPLDQYLTIFAGYALVWILDKIKKRN